MKPISPEYDAWRVYHINKVMYSALGWDDARIFRHMGLTDPALQAAALRLEADYRRREKELALTHSGPDDDVVPRNNNVFIAEMDYDTVTNRVSPCFSASPSDESDRAKLLAYCNGNAALLNEATVYFGQDHVSQFAKDFLS